MNYWWVNQSKTFARAVSGGYLWSPKTKSNGARNPFYETMTQVKKGDIVFSFADTYLKAIAVVTGPHQSGDRPLGYDAADNAWGTEGWLVPVSYSILEGGGLRVRDHMDALGPLLPSKYSPLKSDGRANEAYLCPVPDGMAGLLLQLVGASSERLADIQDMLVEQQELDGIICSSGLSATEKLRLVQSRVGQGVFRANVMVLEPACRITGISDPTFLVASHIRPWALSDNEARLDGYNGLMLAPHIDLLFDRGFITFDDSGTVIVSAQLPEEVRDRWSLVPSVPAKPFSRRQRQYLNGHRNELFRG